MPGFYDSFVGGQRNALARQASEQSIAQNALSAQREQEGIDLKQTLAETQWALQAPDPVAAVKSLPHIAAAWQKHGVNIDTLDPEHAKALLQEGQRRAASQLGIGPPQETFGAAQPVQLPGVNGAAPTNAFAQFGSGGTVRPLTGVSPIEKSREGGFQKTDSGLIFDPGSGQYRDSTGRVLTTNEVAKRERDLAAAKTGATTAAGAAARAGPLDQGALDAQVESWFQTGQVPAGLSRSAVAANRFWHAINDRAVATNNTLAEQQSASRYRASLKPAFEQSQKQLAANAGFLETLHKNIASADALAQRVGGAGSPALNTLFNKWKRHVTGDPDVAAFDFWNNSIQGEAAKIASGGVGSVSASSDTQIQHQRESLNTAQNYAQWRAAANAMLEEGSNRINSIKGALTELQQTSASGSSPVTAPASPPAAAGWKIEKVP